MLILLYSYYGNPSAQSKVKQKRFPETSGSPFGREIMPNDVQPLAPLPPTMKKSDEQFKQREEFLEDWRKDVEERAKARSRRQGARD